MPLYEIEWRKSLPGEDDRVIRTRSTGSTPGKAIANTLNGAGGVMPYEIDGYPPPTVHEVDEDGELTLVELTAEDLEQAG